MAATDYLRSKLRELVSGIEAITNPLPPPPNVIQNIPQAQITPRVQQAIQQTQPLIGEAEQQYHVANPAIVASDTLQNFPQFDFSSRIQNPVGRFLAAVPESVFNIPSLSVQGGARTGANISDILQGRSVPAPRIIGGLTPLAEAALNATTIAAGGGLAKQALKQSIGKTIAKGALQGAAYGGAYGTLQGLQANQNAATIPQQLQGTAPYAAAGALGGAAVGAAIPVASKAIGRGAELYMGMTPTERQAGFLKMPGKENQAETKVPLYNTARLNVSPKAKKTVSQTIEEVKGNIEEVVGQTLSNKEVVRLANSTSRLLNRTINRQQTAEKIAANLNLRQQIAHAAQTGKVDDNFIQALIRDKSAAADIARQLQARAISASPKDKQLISLILDSVLKSHQDTNVVLEAARGVDFNDSEQMTNFYRQFVKPKMEDWITALRYNSMLSSPNTHFTNMSSNFQGTGILAPIEKTVAGGIDFLRSKFSAKPRTQFAGEGVAYTKGYYTNLRQAAHNFWDVMINKSLTQNPDIRAIPLTERGTKAREIENVLKLPQRLLEGMDQFFSTLTEKGVKESLAYRVKKGIKVGLPGIQASQEAEHRLFRGELFDKNQGHLLNMVDELTSKIFSLRSSNNPVTRTIANFTFPFVKTPMNILKQGIEYSPAGVLTLPGSKDINNQIAKILIGSSVASAAATLLGSNRLTWAEPTNATQKADFRAAGRQPYAVKVGDKWISYSRLHPAVAFNLALAAAVDDAMKNKNLGDGTADNILSGFAKWLQFFADQSYLKNMGDFLSSVKGDSESIARYFANYPQQLIPLRAFFGWMSRIVDPVQRKIDTSGSLLNQQIQQAMLSMPFISQKLQARTDRFGNPIMNTNTLFNAFSPTRITTSNPEAEQFLQQQEQVRQQKKELRQQKEKLKVQGGSIINEVQAANEGLIGKIVYLAPSGATKVVNVDNIRNMPDSSAVEKVQKQQAIYRLLNQLINDKQDEGLGKAAKVFNIPEEDARYYNIATKNTQIREAYVKDYLNKTDNTEQALIELTRQVNGKQILTTNGANNLLTKMVKEGLITPSQANTVKIKGIKKLSGGRKHGRRKMARIQKAHKIGSITVQKAKLPSFKISRIKKLRLKKITLTAPKPTKPMNLKIPKSPTKEEFKRQLLRVR